VNVLTKVNVQDYQSIGSAELDLGKLTVIVGRGNLGKSAMIRAITGCLFNETGAGCIRQGQKKATVTLSFDDDQVVTWTKDDKTARYSVDVAGATTDYTKLAGGVPSELQDLFGIKTIEIDKTFSIRPQVHGQFDSPLLLAESSGKAARALAKLTKLEVVVQAQMAAARDLRRTKQEATARAREIEELTTRINEFPDLDRIDVQVARAREVLEGADRKLDNLGVAEDAYHLMVDAMRRLEIEPPTVDELDGLTDRLNKMQNAILARNVLAKAQDSMELTRMAAKRAFADQVDAEETLENFLSELEICPICGQPINGD